MAIWEPLWVQHIERAVFKHVTGPRGRHNVKDEKDTIHQNEGRKIFLFDMAHHMEIGKFSCKYRDPSHEIICEE